MKKTVYCAALCIMQYAAYGIFNHIPGDQIWVMVDQIGRTNQAIEGFATPITTDTAGPVTINNLPVTITVPGRYAAVEPLSYTPSNATDYPITIDADNVYLTLNGYTLTVGNKTANAINIADGRNNISIVHGGISGGNAVFFEGNHNGITVDDLHLTDVGTAGTGGIAILGASNNINISNIRENGLQNASDGINIQSSTNIRIHNCSLDNNVNSGLVLSGCQHATIENIVTNKMTLYGMLIAFSSDVYITNCSAAAIPGGVAPNAYNIYAGSEHVVLNNCSSVGNGTNSIGLIIDGTAISCKNFSSYNDQYGIIVGDSIPTSSLITIENSTIELAAVNGILFDTDVSNVLLQNVTVMSAGSTAISGTNGTNIIFKNLNLLDLVGAAGILFTTVDNFVLKNSSLIGHYPTPTTLVDIINISNISNSLLKNNTLIGNQNLSNGINFDTTVLNTCLLDNYVSNATSRGILTVIATNYVLANNTVANNSEGIDITNGTACAIRNCTCDNNLFHGIGFGGTKSAITHNNVNFDNQTSVANTGIAIDPASPLNYIGFNNIVLRGSGPGSAAVGITEGIQPVAGNAYLGNMIQNFSNGTSGGGASVTTSFYTFATFHCDPSISDTAPASHWENLHIIYS